MTDLTAPRAPTVGETLDPERLAALRARYAADTL